MKESALSVDSLRGAAGAVRDAAGAGDRIIQKFAASKEAVAEALEDGRRTVRHAIRRTRDTAEDLIDDATHNIRRFPIRSVAAAFAAGALMGVLISRNGRR